MADYESPAETFTCEVCHRSLDRWAPATRLERMANREYLGDPIRWNEPGYCHPENEDVADALGWRIVSRGVLRDLDRGRRTERSPPRPPSSRC